MLITSRHGFTLIEVLVVVVVVGIMAGVVVASFGSQDREQALQGYVERLGVRIEMARDRALQRNREWGFYVEDEGLRFAEFDGPNQRWVDLTQRPFRAEAYAAEVELSVKVDQYQNATRKPDEEEIPDVILYSSGETTPFRITVEPREWEARHWYLASDGFTRTELEREEE
ncbi:MAG: type II secretion system minor pseudopilin GspH [Pseudomonadota bacterium]